MKHNVLVVDIGGTNVKLMMSRFDKRKFKSGPKMTARDFAKEFHRTVNGWDYEKISIGFPSPVRDGKIMCDPKHLGTGWRRMNFTSALGKPTRIINDAAMQALGSHHGGRMLFLGLGTGLGSALVWGTTVLPLELGDLPYREQNKIEDFLGKDGLAELGRKAWQSEVLYAVTQLKLSFIADTVVLGGGNVKQLGALPEGLVPGGNRNAYLGGWRLWQTDPRTRRPRWTILS
ncbi:MAG: ROK family protein [Verrucomicrobiota bacterium]|nr:ROK family protein [Verrucomicrobiota bacterium]